MGAGRVLGDVHDRQVVLLGKVQGLPRAVQQDLQVPALGVLPDLARADEGADLDRDARLLRDLDDRLDVGDDGAAGHVDADVQPVVGHLLGEACDVVTLALPGARQADVGRADPELVHQVDEPDLVVEPRVQDARRLEPVAQRLVVEQDRALGVEGLAPVDVPVVDQVLEFAHSSRLVGRSPGAAPGRG